jgi:long-subunit fatty acid transport protein
VYERWSVLKEIQVRPKNITVNIPSLSVSAPLENVVMTKNFNDSYSVRGGADYQVIPERLTVRGGYTYESSAIPSAYTSVDFFGWGRHIAAAGLSVQLWGAYLDVAYAHHFIATRNVTDSKVTQVTTPDIGTGRPPSSVVGNGTYQASLDVVSLALRIPFSELRGTL